MLPRKQRDHRSRRDAGALWPRRVFRDKVRMRAQEVLRHSLVFPAQDRAGAVEQHAAGADIFRLLRKNGTLQGGQLRRGLVIADIRLFPDDAESGARHIGQHDVHRAAPRGHGL